jgi:hypothetical protein
MHLRLGMLWAPPPTCCVTGVTFQSPVDGSRMLLTPEESIAIQNNLGADIMMQLDDVVPATNTGAQRLLRPRQTLARLARSVPDPFGTICGGVSSIHMATMTTMALPTKREHPLAEGSVHGKEPHQANTGIYIISSEPATWRRVCRSAHLTCSVAELLGLCTQIKRGLRRQPSEPPAGWTAA